jgi:hypothetical protein
VLRADAEELSNLELEAGQAGIGVGGAGHRAADGEIVDSDAEDIGQRVDIVGAAGKASGGVDLGGNRVDARQLEGIAVVGIAVAERDDIVDPLGGGGRRGQPRGGEQRQGKQAAIKHEVPPRMPHWTRGGCRH